MMTLDGEDKLNQQIEEFIDADTRVSEWIDVYFNKEDGIPEINKGDLNIFFEGCGAKEPSSEVQKQLSFNHYGQKQRSSVMREIWGDKYSKFKEWIKDEYIPEAENKGVKLFHLKNKPDSKSEGMLSFFADMTALAFASEGGYSFENFDLITSNRMRSYETHIKGGWKKEDFQITISGYNENKPFAPASFPPDFPSRALEKIRTWSNLL